MTTGAAEGRVEMLGAIPEGSGQKLRVAGSGAANVTGRKATHWPEAATGLMEKIVSRGNMMAAYSSERLKLTVNQTKSAVDRPLKRSFLSYSMTWHSKPRLTVAKKAVAILKANLKTIFRQGRGKRIQTTVEELTPKCIYSRPAKPRDLRIFV